MGKQKIAANFQNMSELQSEKKKNRKKRIVIKVVIAIFLLFCIVFYSIGRKEWFYEAVNSGNLAQTKFIVSILRVDPNNINDPYIEWQLGGSALHKASYNKDLEMIRYLLKKGADPNVSGCCASGTPLYIAASQGNYDVVNELLEGGADPENGGFNMDQETPLEAARKNSHSDVVELLENQNTFESQ